MQNMWKTMHARGSLADQEAVELLSSKSQPWWIENLSTGQKVSRWIKNLLRSYRDKVQKVRWIEIALTSVETRRKKGLIDSNLSRICREVVELSLKKKCFQRKEKHIEMNATSKLLKQGSNQHIKLLKDISQQNNARHLRSKNTHAHTLNKSNQFYISKTSQDSLVSIH